MFNFDDLVYSGEDDFVVSHYGSAAYGGYADLAFSTGFSVALALINVVLTARYGFRRGVCQEKRSAAGRIQLFVMVALNYLDIIVFAQYSRRASNELPDEVDTERHIARTENGHNFGDALDHLQLVAGVAGCTENSGRTGGDAPRQEIVEIGWVGKINNHIAGNFTLGRGGIYGESGEPDAVDIKTRYDLDITAVAGETGDRLTHPPVAAGYNYLKHIIIPLKALLKKPDLLHGDFQFFLVCRVHAAQRKAEITGVHAHQVHSSFNRYGIYLYKQLVYQV